MVARSEAQGKATHSTKDYVVLALDLGTASAVESVAEASLFEAP